MNVTIEIDLKDQKSRNALRALINAMEVDEVVETVQVEEPKQEVEEPKKAPAKKSAPKKEAAKQEVAEVKQEKAEPKQEKSEAEPEEVKEENHLSIEDVRVLLASKIQKHRAAIKAKLTELEADNLTKLDPDKYEDFNQFLSDLD